MAPSPRAGVLAVVALVLGAIPATASEPSFEGEASVTLVAVPVEVERRGEPVRGLEANDFAVLEDGRELPVVAFETVELGAAGAPVDPLRVLAPAARRHLFLLFDFAFSEPRRIAEGVAAARRLVEGGLDPTDLVGVGVYLPRGELSVLLHFTPDRVAADRVLAALGAELGGEPPAASPGEAARDPLRLTGEHAPSLLSQLHLTDERNFPRDTLRSLPPPHGKKGAPDLLHNLLSHAATVVEPQVESRRRAHVRSMAESVTDLAATLRPVQGRKLLALFSEGMPIAVVGGVNLNGYDSNQPDTGGSELLGRLEETLRDLRGEGWVLHAIDLSGTRRADLGDDALFFLADRTGGELIALENDAAKGLGRALEASAHAYLLTVQVDGLPFDGAFHPLDVRLREERGVTLRHRQGYHAPQVRVLVRDRRDGRATLRSIPLDVASAQTVGERLDALFLTPSGDPWVLVPPHAGAFLVRGLPILPAGQATLPEAGEARLLLVGSGLDVAGAALASRVLDAAGRSVDGAAVELLGVTPGVGGEPDLVIGRLQAGTLPPGTYTLEVTLAGESAAGPRSARPFLVVPAEG